MTIKEIEGLTDGQARQSESLRKWADFVATVATSTFGLVFRKLWMEYWNLPVYGRTKSADDFGEWFAEGINKLVDTSEFLTKQCDGYTIPANCQFSEMVRNQNIGFATRFYLGMTPTSSKSLADVRKAIRTNGKTPDQLLGTMPTLAKSEAA